MNESLIREQIERRLILLYAKLRRHRKEARLSSPQPGRDLAPLHLAATQAGIDELLWVLQIMLALAMKQALEDDSLLAALVDGDGGEG